MKGASFQTRAWPSFSSAGKEAIGSGVKKGIFYIKLKKYMSHSNSNTK